MGDSGTDVTPFLSINNDDDMTELSVATLTKPKPTFVTRAKPACLGCLCGIICTVTTILVVLIVTLLTLYFVLGVYAFNTIFLSNQSTSSCLRSKATPSIWSVNFSKSCPALQSLATGNNTYNEYKIPVENWKWIAFPSRHAAFATDMNITALLVTHTTGTNRPFVIVVHGIHGCNIAPNALADAGLLFHNGYNVLIPDLRNHGSSQIDNANPYVTFGHAEHLDVLGGYDYLVRTYGENQAVGLMGHSMGAATALVAYAQETKLKACFADSPPANVWGTIYGNAVDLVRFRILASLLLSGAKSVSKTKSRYGFPPFKYDPLDSCKRIGNRPLFLLQDYTDVIVPPVNTIECLLAAKSTANGTTTNIHQYFADTGIYKNVRSGACDGHCKLRFSNVQVFRDKAINFFDRYMNV